MCTQDGERTSKVSINDDWGMWKVPGRRRRCMYTTEQVQVEDEPKLLHGWGQDGRAGRRGGGQALALARSHMLTSNSGRVRASSRGLCWGLRPARSFPSSHCPSNSNSTDAFLHPASALVAPARASIRSGSSFQWKQRPRSPPSSRRSSLACPSPHGFDWHHRASPPCRLSITYLSCR